MARFFAIFLLEISFFSLSVAQGFSEKQYQTPHNSLKNIQAIIDTIMQNFPMKDYQISYDSLNAQAISDTSVQQKQDSSYMNFMLDAFCNVLGVSNYNAPTFTEPNNVLLYVR
jgi:hypothetical protein